jgi:D-alanine-D-alanine ligase
MRIAILAYLEPDAQEPDVVVPQVKRALENAGHETRIITIRDDVAAMVQELSGPRPDLVFNLVESFGNDIIGGLIGVTGVLDLLQLPHTGGGPGELYLQEDKTIAKKLLAYEQVQYPSFASFTPDADFETGGKLRMPLFVKPSRMDASQGIDQHSLVRNTQELMERVLHIHREFGDAALAEEFIEGRELYVGVLGNSEPVAFPPIEMDFSGLPPEQPHILDSQAKWDESSPQYQGTTARMARLPDELLARVQRVAVSAYRALRVRDYGRIDLRVTEAGEIYVIEVNANCYLEEASEFARAAAAAGTTYVELVNQIVNLAAQRFPSRALPS